MTDLPRRLQSRPGMTLFAVLVVAAAIVAVALTVRLLPAQGETTDQAALLATGTPRIVFAEYGPNADDIYIAPADAPGERTLVDSVEHAPGWAINPGPAMSGTTFAFTVLAPGSEARQDAPAELWLVDVATGERTRLARDADLLIAPRFTGDGESVIYRRSTASEQEIVEVDLGTSTRRVVHAERTTFGILPIGYAADKGLVYARLSASGTDLLSVREGSAPVPLFQASEDIARDWALAPDGRAIAYLAVEEVLESMLHRVHVQELATGDPVPFERLAGIEGEQYGPAWTGDGAALAVGQQATPAGPGAVVVASRDGEARMLQPPEQGFDVPIAWSADSRFLAARTFTGPRSSVPGDEFAVILDADGHRYPLEAEAEVIFIGWIDHA